MHDHMQSLEHIIRFLHYILIPSKIYIRHTQYKIEFKFNVAFNSPKGKTPYIYTNYFNISECIN